jgi:hypothetical protein
MIQNITWLEIRAKKFSNNGFLYLEFSQKLKQLEELQILQELFEES